MDTGRDKGIIKKKNERRGRKRKIHIKKTDR